MKSKLNLNIGLYTNLEIENINELEHDQIMGLVKQAIEINKQTKLLTPIETKTIETKTPNTSKATFKMVNFANKLGGSFILGNASFDEVSQFITEKKGNK